MAIAAGYADANDNNGRRWPLRAFDTAAAHVSIFDALIAASRKHGAKKPILEDQERNPLTYTDLLRGAFALGRKISGFTAKGERVASCCRPASAGW